jgi:hypothetical protein
MATRVRQRFEFNPPQIHGFFSFSIALTLEKLKKGLGLGFFKNLQLLTQQTF